MQPRPLNAKSLVLDINFWRVEEKANKNENTVCPDLESTCLHYSDISWEPVTELDLNDVADGQLLSLDVQLLSLSEQYSNIDHPNFKV